MTKETICSNVDTMQLDGVSVTLPDPTFNAMFIFEHIWSHFVAAGVGFRQICDWAVFLQANKSKIDLGKLDSMLISLDLLKPWKVFGWIAVNFLGLSRDDMPFYDTLVSNLSKKVLGMVMKEGNFGHEWEERWYESGHKLVDVVKHFLIITRRYLKVVPMFGNIAFQEYKTKVLYHLLK